MLVLPLPGATTGTGATASAGGTAGSTGIGPSISPSLTSIGAGPNGLIAGGFPTGGTPTTGFPKGRTGGTTTGGNGGAGGMGFADAGGFPTGGGFPATTGGPGFGLASAPGAAAGKACIGDLPHGAGFALVPIRLAGGTLLVVVSVYLPKAYYLFLSKFELTLSLLTDLNPFFTTVGKGPNDMYNYLRDFFS